MAPCSLRETAESTWSAGAEDPSASWQAENSEVFPVGKCVAVAVIEEPTGAAETAAWNATFPEVSVVAVRFPRKVPPSPNPLGSH